MQLVLSRSIKASNGITYPEGTPLDQLPLEHRESLAGICWTRPAPAKPVIVVPPPPAADDIASESGSEAEPESESEPPQPEPMPEPPVDDSPSIDTLKLGEDVLSKLRGAGIETIAQARAYALANKGFRTIKGIVKATNEQIIDAISEE